MNNKVLKNEWVEFWIRWSIFWNIDLFRFLWKGDITSFAFFLFNVKSPPQPTNPNHMFRYETLPHMKRAEGQEDAQKLLSDIIKDS